MTHLLLALAAMFALGAVIGGLVAWAIPPRPKPSYPQDEYDAEDVAGHQMQEISEDEWLAANPALGPIVHPEMAVGESLAYINRRYGGGL